MTAEEVIRRLELQPHPEGGWYRETWRGEATDGGRGAGTAIHYLLKRGERSGWHRVDAAELWLHQGGGSLRLSTAAGGVVATRRLGGGLQARAVAGGGAGGGLGAPRLRGRPRLRLLRLRARAAGVAPGLALTPGRRPLKFRSDSGCCFANISSRPPNCRGLAQNAL